MNNYKLNKKTKKIILFVLLAVLLVGISIAIWQIVRHFTNSSNNNSNSNSNSNSSSSSNSSSDSSDSNKRLFKFNGNSDVVRGYFLMSWKPNNTAPDGDWDFGVWFGGETPKSAIEINLKQSYKITSGKKILNLGGGLDTGKWSDPSELEYVVSRLSDIKSNGWDGLCFDVEVCVPNVDFIKAFQDCFAACKRNGLMVIVTMSHTLPYDCQTGTGQGVDLVNSWINDDNIDYISPQLYSAGDKMELSDLSIFKNIQNKIIPAIPYETDWDTLKNSSFININPKGYIIWNVPAGTPSTSSNYCGTSWTDAKTKCQVKCPSGQDSECPAGERCFGDITDCSGTPTNYNYCGFDWTDASSRCQTKCPGGKDSECPSGQHCFADITSC
jgi:hypothetical protein